MEAIEFDDITSWPYELTTYLHNNSDLVRGFCDQIQPIQSRPFEFKDILPTRCISLIDDVYRMLTPKIVKAYHCTRLTNLEVEAIRCDGLRLPSIPLWQEKIKNSQNNERAGAQRLMQFVGVGLKSYEIINPKIHFCLSAELLRNPAATHRFFRSWGGENLYVNIEENPEFKEVLGTGTASIVIANLRTTEIVPHSHVVTMFIRQFMHHLDCSSEVEAAECWAQQPVLPSSIVSIIQYGNDGFSRLSSFSEETF